MPTYPRFFSGDWEIPPTLGDETCYQFAFEAVAADPDWNGFAAPIVTREVAEAWAARQALLRAADPGTPYLDLLDAGGHAFLVSNPDGDSDEEPPFLLTPDSRGLYHLGRLGLCFNWLDEEDRVINYVRATEPPGAPAWVVGLPVVLTLRGDTLEVEVDLSEASQGVREEDAPEDLYTAVEEAIKAGRVSFTPPF